MTHVIHMQVEPNQFLDALAFLMNMATSNAARAPNGAANGGAAV